MYDLEDTSTPDTATTVLKTDSDFEKQHRHYGSVAIGRNTIRSDSSTDQETYSSFRRAQVIVGEDPWASQQETGKDYRDKGFINDL